MDVPDNYAVSDEQAAKLQRSRGSVPLFRGLPTGPYTYRYRDAGTGPDVADNVVDGMLNSNSGDQSEEGTERQAQEMTSSLPLTTALPSADSEEQVIYRETTAVANGAMTLLSKQVAVEAPTTGAKGRAREREAKRPGISRFMPSQELIDAARKASYPPLTAEGTFAKRPNEMLLVGCRPEGAAGWRERETSLDGNVLGVRFTPSPELVQAAARSGDETVAYIYARAPGGERNRSDGRETTNNDRLLYSNPGPSTFGVAGAPARERAAHLEHRRLAEENANLREEIARLRLSQHAPLVDDVEVDTIADQAAFTPSEALWKGLGNQPRRSAIRGGNAGGSVMSQEVMVESYAAGRGRAREREERRRAWNLGVGLRDGEGNAELDGDSDFDVEGNKNVQHASGRSRSASSESGCRGRPEMRDPAAAALANLPPDVLAKYAADRPSRIWRDHSHEILVGSGLTGSRGRRREVDMKREREQPRFMPSAAMRDAAALTSLEKRTGAQNGEDGTGLGGRDGIDVEGDAPAMLSGVEDGT